MNKVNSFLVVILARAGSKRLPNKNVRILNNKPLIAWSIEASKSCKYITKTLLSSDSQEICDIGKEFGADVPFLRPSSLSLDTTSSIDSVIHAVNYYKNELKETFDYTILLQPTSPLRTSKHLEQAIELLVQKNADAVVSVCEMEHSPVWSNTLDSSLSMKDFLNKDYINKRSQDLESYYRINGAIYICKTDILLKEKTFFVEDKIFGFKMKQEDSIDIDTLLDFKFAELIMKEK